MAKLVQLLPVKKHENENVSDMQKYLFVRFACYF